MITYALRDDGHAITCLRCGLTSWNKNDVENLFCGMCNKFHIPIDPVFLTEPMYRLLDAIQHGDLDPTLEEGRPFTIRLWQALIARHLVGHGPTVTELGLQALQAFESPS
jgi:hypothetical protein